MQQTTEEYTQSRIDAMGLYSIGVKRLLKKCNGVIAGSFPLQCVLRETYADSDIDFFFPVRARREVEKWFQKYCAGQKLGDPVGNYPKGTDTGNPYYPMNQIHSVYKFLYKKACVNIIFVNTNDIPQYVQSSFDMSFCKTMYDGRRIRFSDNTLKKVGETCFVKTHSHFQRQRTEQRIAKYTARGFTVFDAGESERLALLSDPMYSDSHILKLVSKLPQQKFYKVAVRAASPQAWRAFLENFKTAQRVRINYPYASVKFDNFTVNLEPFMQNRHHAEVLVYTKESEVQDFLASGRKVPYVIVDRTPATPVQAQAPTQNPVAARPVYTPVPAPAVAPAPPKTPETPATPYNKMDLSDAEATARVCQLEFQLSKLLEQLAQKTKKE